MSTKVGVILAGGQSRRMGQDKALMPFRGERLIDRAIGKLLPQVDVLLVNRATRPDGLDPRVLLAPDVMTGFQGPLAGVHAALTQMKSSAAQDYSLFTVPVDSPFFPMDLVERLAGGDQPVAFAASQNQRHPVFARWPAHALDTLTSALHTGNRKIDRVAEELGFDEVHWDLVEHANSQALDPFANINTMDEFSALEPSA